MIFEQESISFQLLDVLYLDQENAKFSNANRNFDALSYRFEVNTTIETKKHEFEFKDHTGISPSRWK